jgi:hypothetical protein
MTETTDSMIPEIETVAKSPADEEALRVAATASAEDAAREAAQDELLRVRPSMSTLGLHELSLASIAILKRIKSPIIDGVHSSDIENLPLELAKLLVVQRVDLMDDEALDALMLLTKDADRLDAEAMKVAREIEGNIASLYLAILDMIRRSNTTAIRVMPRKERRGHSDLSALANILSDTRPKA